MSNDRFTTERRVLRTQLAFWKRGEDSRASTGFSTDISPSGAFIACHAPFPRGTAIDIKVETSEGTIVVSGRVTRSVKVPLQLRRIRTAGMGVRFDAPLDPGVLQLNSMGQHVSTAIKY